MVPVILTKCLQESVEVLVKMRSSGGVSAENLYLFPCMTSSTGHFRADVILKSMAEACGARAPETLRGTQLRKHVATMTQLLNLQENELDAVASYMGHDTRVHRQYYRMQTDTTQLAKASKLLLAMEGGDMQRLKGSNLDDIMVDHLIGAQKEPENENEDDEDEVPARGTKRPAKPISSGQKKQKVKNEDKIIVHSYIKRFISNMQTPGISDVKKFQVANPKFQEMKWQEIKYMVYNAFAHKKEPLSNLVLLALLDSIWC
ncbi:hypothetical protein ONE63_003520 [Megalurothrips usitatus]|uniref:Tyr recombinase domain-containing protein n=1 Tax=Megalurothrips usitatus TaxID=439358 RepID=A0AAV7X5S2_9NEOP|nr:hypothetical protein ONE63_003520 [Megalurothrips usitatus]